MYTGWRFKWIGMELYATDQPGDTFNVVLGDYDVDTLHLYNIAGDVDYSAPDVTFGQALERARTHVTRLGGTWEDSVPDPTEASSG